MASNNPASQLPVFHTVSKGYQASSSLSLEILQNPDLADSLTRLGEVPAEECVPWKNQVPGGNYLVMASSDSLADKEDQARISKKLKELETMDNPADLGCIALFGALGGIYALDINTDADQPVYLFFRMLKREQKIGDDTYRGVVKVLKTALAGHKTV